jgi:hypothetical protein
MNEDKTIYIVEDCNNVLKITERKPSDLYEGNVVTVMGKRGVAMLVYELNRIDWDYPEWQD